jgi:hypothetical protein
MNTSFLDVFERRSSRDGATGRREMPTEPSTSFLQLPLNHIGYTVENLEQAIEGWVKTHGAGPFYVLADMQFDELEFMGEPIEWEHVAAYGNCGAIGVELQTFVFPTPIPELERRLGGPYHLNHVCYLADDTPAASQRLEKLGYSMFLYGRSGPDRFYWHDAPFLGHAIELHSDIEAIRGFIRAADRSAHGWNGSEPLRTQLPEGLPDASKAFAQGQV